MNFFYEVTLNTILILFPILIYFIIKIYCLPTNKNDRYYFALCTFISLGLILLFAKKSFLELSIILFIPLLFNYIRGNKFSTILLSLFMIVFYNYCFSINIYLLVSEYLIYFITYNYLYRRNILITSFINKFIIIRSFFLSFYVFSLYNNYSLNMNLTYMLFSIIISYLVSFSYYYILNTKFNAYDYHNLKKEINHHNNIRNYLSAINHELKNSLSICKGYLDMFDLKKDNTKKYLRIVKKEMNRSIEMLQEGLNISKNSLNFEIMDVNVLLEDVSETVAGLFKRRKIKYHVKYIDDDIYILGDYNRLKQVLINLLKNACEAKEQNLIIEIGDEIIKDNVCITIKDNGCGIKDLTKIGHNYSTKANGSGIGTMLSKSIIENHNGKIIYESNVKEGTIVNILLPMFK